MKIVFFTVLLFLIFTTLSVPALGEESPKILFEGPQTFSIDLPQGWDVEHNAIFFESGWIASLYDNLEEWNVQIDISLQSSDLPASDTNKQTTIENLFVSYYYICQNNTFERNIFEKLPNELNLLLKQYHQQQLADAITETTNISNWWYELTDDEINTLFKNKQIELSDYLIGYMCSDFTPLDYQIIKNDDVTRYQLFYTWKQTFPDDTYFENYSQMNDLWIKHGPHGYIISINSLSTISYFEIHNDSVEELMDSIEILEHVTSIAPKIFTEIRINMGWWANGQLPDSDFEYDLELIINSNIVPRLSSMIDQDKIDITSVPQWLKIPTNYWYEQELTDDEYINLLTNLLEREIIEFKISRDI